MESLESFGVHRVVAPVGAFPQGAEVVDGDSALKSPHEALVQVSELLLDSTSMRELRGRAGCAEGTSEALREAIAGIVRARGKMHNPVTNSGGVLVGTVRAVGEGCRGFPEVGSVVVPLSSISALPLSLGRIVACQGDRVVVEDTTAVVFSAMTLVKIPEDLGKDLALAALDISSLVPQVDRTLRGILAAKADGAATRVLVLGCGKAGVCALFKIREVAAATGMPVEVLAFDFDQAACDRVSALGLAGRVMRGDARDAPALFGFTGGETIDLVLNVVNIPGTETATVLVTRPGGVVLWFSMATRFDRAALATDALGKDVRMLIGNGVAEGQAEAVFELIRANERLREFFAGH
jgi:L-erythro-3,5-diaminohexanoate dehydrogenase